MNKKFILILVSMLVFSCNSPKNSKVERVGEPDVYNVDDSDSEMNDAMAKAKNTFNLFEDAFKGTGNKNTYSVKQKFSSADGDIEHIWIGDIEKKGSDYYGTINNEPVYVTAIELGSTVKIDLEQLSDWMIIDNETGKVKGGYTIQVLRNKMSEEERQQFDSDSGLIFE